MTSTTTNPDRCTRCGKVPLQQDKFCSECGGFLRDAWTDHRLLLALVHERQGRSREAQKELERIIELEPDHVLANHTLGTLYFHEGMLDRAIEKYQVALRSAPEFVLGHYDLGVASYHRGNMIEAAAAFSRCLAINPDYKAAHYRLALSLFHAGRLDEAYEHFCQSVLLTPEYLMAHYHMGVIHERRGELQHAMREFQKSLDDGFHEVSSLYHLTKLRATEASLRAGDPHLEQVNE
jgi:tetratricopeptide (TPR) repeat protein